MLKSFVKTHVFLIRFSFSILFHSLPIPTSWCSFLSPWLCWPYKAPLALKLLSRNRFYPQSPVLCPPWLILAPLCEAGFMNFFFLNVLFSFLSFFFLSLSPWRVVFPGPADTRRRSPAQSAPSVLFHSVPPGPPRSLSQGSLRCQGLTAFFTPVKWGQVRKRPLRATAPEDWSLSLFSPGAWALLTPG